jgi:regulator of replication initiation timing
LDGFIILLKIENAREKLFDLISDLLQREKEMIKENKSLNEENISLTKQIEESVELTKSLVQEKKIFETQLYTKFALVLNQKKAKIRNLKQKSKNLIFIFLFFQYFFFYF